MAQLDAFERRTGLLSTYREVPQRLSHLPELLHEQAGRPMVVLVDEYDKPMLDTLKKA